MARKYNPDVARRASKAFYQRNTERLIEYAKRRRRELRDAALEHYGRECACCGEAERAFLTLDHIKPKGGMKSAYERKALPAWLKKHGYPDGFQTLCWNCNMAKAVGPSCPHTNKE